MKLLKSFRHGQRGFTLIELLVVVAILGILAAVVIPNVMGMIGTGRVESANTESHDVEVAVLAAMVDQDVYSLTANGTVGPNGAGDANVTLGIAELDPGVENYLTGILQAIYTLDTDGHILSATTTDVTDSKWEGLTYEVNVGWSESE